MGARVNGDNKVGISRGLAWVWIWNWDRIGIMGVGIIGIGIIGIWNRMGIGIIGMRMGMGRTGIGIANREADGDMNGNNRDAEMKNWGKYGW